MKRAVAMGSCNAKLVKRSMMTAFSVLAAGSILSTSEVFADSTPTSQANRPVNYQTEATTAVQGLIGSYWNSSGNQFENTPGGSYTGNYWWEANGLYALADADLATNSTAYSSYMNHFIAGLQNQYGTQMYDSWNDDEGWLGIALMQAVKAKVTNLSTAFPVVRTTSSSMSSSSVPALVQDAEALQADIENSWTSEGGITWDKPSAGSSWYNPYYRDTAANMTDTILSTELYAATRNKSYLTDAKQVFDWEWNTLVLPTGGNVNGTDYQPGTVMDGVDWNPQTQQNTYPNGGTAQWTYNYGTVVGAAVELFKLTGDSTYLTDAKLVANAAINQFAKANDVMAGVETGGGDGGLFKGIFMRYMIELLSLDRQNQNLDNFIQTNLSSLWDNDQTSTAGVFGNNWAGPAPSASSVDLTDELSAVMSLTHMATFQHRPILTLLP
jgi:predicted alpha-1,6-mannanase (GH76 family)